MLPLVKQSPTLLRDDWQKLTEKKQSAVESEEEVLAIF